MPEDFEKKKRAMDMLTEMLASTGISDFVLMNKSYKFQNKLQDLVFDKNSNDETRRKLGAIIDQFNDILDDFIESEEN